MCLLWDVKAQWNEINISATYGREYVDTGTLLLPSENNDSAEQTI